MPSYDYGKNAVIAWIKSNFKTEANILDVGACDGKYAKLLPEYKNIDAVEAWKPNITEHRLTELYRNCYHAEIQGFQYPQEYDLVLFCDVLEHMSVADAQNVLKNAKAKTCIVALPFKYKQGVIYGNPYEIHVQDDLTKDLVRERYPQLKELYSIPEVYAYYVWRKSKCEY